jgi:hypothetical protein
VLVGPFEKNGGTFGDTMGIVFYPSVYEQIRLYV